MRIIRDNEINIIHFASQTIIAKTNAQLAKMIEHNKVVKPKNLTILTMFTDKEKAMLCKQLDESGVDYINVIEGIDYIDFKHQDKAKFYLSALKNVDTDYVLIIDSYDTLIQTFDSLIERFEESNCDILFNACWCNYPYEEIEDTSIYGATTRFRFFNSGVCLGRTDAVKEFYTKTREVYDELHVEGEIKAEQYFMRHCIKRYYSDGKRVKIDYDNKISLVTIRSEFDKRENEWILDNSVIEGQYLPMYNIK